MIRTAVSLIMGLILALNLDPTWALDKPSSKRAAQAPFPIAIDIGHTPDRPGAISATGKPEYLFNRAVAGMLLKELKERRIPAFIINPGGKPISLKGRVQVAITAKARAFISIHHDSVQPKYLKEWPHKGKTRRYSNKFSGYSLFLSAHNQGFEKALPWAQATGSNLLQAGFRPTLHHAEPIPGENRPLIDKKLGIYRFDGLAVLKASPMPALLVECGIIVNRTEEAALETEEVRTRIVRALAGAIEKTFGFRNR